MIFIDGNAYDIPIQKIERSADFLDKFAERTNDGTLHRELIGVYFNYQLTLGSTEDVDEYHRLWEKLTEPQEYHEVTVPDEAGDYVFTAYFSNVKDRLRKQKGSKNYWNGLTVNFISRKPERTPA